MAKNTQQGDEFENAQAELAGYSRNGRGGGLAGAVRNLNAELLKARGGKQMTPDMGADSDDGDDEWDDDEETEGAEGDGAEMSADSDDEDEDEDEEEEEAPPARPAPAAKGAPVAKGASLKRSRSADQHSEELLKSLLLGENGEPTPAAEVIEVSDVLTGLTETMAKSYGDLAEQIGTQQGQLDQTQQILKSMLRLQERTAAAVAQIGAEVNRLRQQRPASTPNPGVSMAITKGGGLNRQKATMTKSKALEVLQHALDSERIESEQFSILAGSLDTRGVQAVLGQLGDDIVGDILAEMG